MARVHTLVLGRLQTNCYILESEEKSIIIDPGDEPERILRFVEDIRAAPKLVVATHAHFDHILGVDRIKTELEIPFAIHKEDIEILESMQTQVRQFMGYNVPPPPKPDQFLADGQEIAVGDGLVKVIHTPGHSPGSISLSGDGYVFTGDALFHQSIGRTDLHGGDPDMLIRSIRNRLFTLDDETVVYPGHGPETSVGDEKVANPFVGQLHTRTR
jgi:hydroxyacylglutathione hydrolase